MPAAIRATGPGTAVVVPPPHIGKTCGPKFTSVQLFYNGVLSNSVWMPVANSLPGFLTTYVENADGTVNDVNHPAAIGSTITLFATGMGLTNPPVVPGSIAHSTSIQPATGVYSTWTYAWTSAPRRPTPPETVISIPGFLSSIFKIQVKVSDAVIYLSGVLDNGVSGRTGRRAVPAASVLLSGGIELCGGIHKVATAMLDHYRRKRRYQQWPERGGGPCVQYARVNFCTDAAGPPS